MVPQQAEPGQEWKRKKNDAKGDSVIWIMGYKTPKGIAVISGRVMYIGISFVRVIKVKHSGIEMTQNMKGRWLGQCK